MIKFTIGYPDRVRGEVGAEPASPPIGTQGRR